MARVEADVLAHIFERAAIALHLPRNDDEGIEGNAQDDAERDIAFYDETLTSSLCLDLPPHVALPGPGTNAPNRLALPLAPISHDDTLHDVDAADEQVAGPPALLRAFLGALQIFLDGTYIPPLPAPRTLPSSAPPSAFPRSASASQLSLDTAISPGPGSATTSTTPLTSQPTASASNGVPLPSTLTRDRRYARALDAPASGAVAFFGAAWAGDKAGPAGTKKQGTDAQTSGDVQGASDPTPVRLSMGELRWQPLGAADSEETGREVQGESQRPEGKWIVCWRCDVPVVFMRTRVPDPVLSLTVTATLRLDPSVLREALNPHSPAAAATLSTSESMKTLPSSSSLNSLASFTDPSADPGTFTEIDLLGGLAEGPYYPGEDQQNASGRSNLAHLPLSRFPARVLGARLSTPETGARDLAARTKSSFPAPPNAEPASASTAVQSEGRQEAGADVDGVRILRRSCRRVLDVRSAVQVRMRTVLAPSLPESIKGANSEQDNAFEQLRNGTASHALVLCVELENPSQSGLRFAVSSVRIEIAPPPAPPATASSSIGAKRDPRAEATLLQPEGRFPMILDQADQQNLLYYVQFEADELEIANAIGNSSAAGDAQRFVSIVVEGRPLLLGQTGDRNSSDEPDGHHTDGQSKTAGPAGSSSSEDEPHSYAPTAPFLSRWNCTLDLSPLRRALERERVFRAPLTTDPLEPHGKQDNVRSSWPATASNGALQAPASVIAGSVRHTASALARASATDAALAQRTNRALGPPRRPSSPPTTAGTGTTHRSSAPTPGAIADPNGRRGLAVPPTPNWARSPGRSSSNPSLPALGPAFMGAPLSSAALPLRSPSSPVTPRTGSWRTPSSAGLLAQSQARAASAQFANSRRESMSAYPGSGSESAYLHDTRRSSVPPEGQGPGTGDFRSPSAVRRDRSSVLGTSSVGGPQTPGWRDSIHRSLEDKNEILPWGTNTATAGAGAGAGRKEPPPPSPDQTALLVTLRVRPGPQDHDSFSKLNISSSSTEPTLMALQPFALEVLIFNRTYETRSLLLSWAGRNGSEDSNLMSANTDEWEMRPIQRSRLLDAEGARRKYADIKMAQRQASIVPLENHIQLGPLYPSTVETVHLPLLALSSGTRSLGSLILADLETGVERTLAELGYVFVHPPRTQNQTEMGLEPGAGATRGLTHGVGVPVVA